jgi:hypothetical protein
VSEQDSSLVKNVDRDALWRLKSLERRRVWSVQRQPYIINTRAYWVQERPGIVEFLSTLKADLVRPSIDREHAAQPTVMAAPKDELENPKQ